MTAHSLQNSSEMTGGRWRVQVLYNHLPARFHRRGIGPALICAAAADLAVRLCSSRREGTAPGEYRTPDAERVWNALVRRDLAAYDPADDRYTLLVAMPHGPAAAAR